MPILAKPLYTIVLGHEIYLPQRRFSPQSKCTKFEREYRPTPPAAQEKAARAIWRTDFPCIRRSAACPLMCSEFLATLRERARSKLLVAGVR